jgi:metal-sulfur cluster biosynthetic enzyme
MLTIDGSRYSGSGTIVRQAVAFSALTCPIADALLWQIDKTVRTLPSVTDVTVNLVWDPPWNRSMMSESAKIQLGLP